MEDVRLNEHMDTIIDLMRVAYSNDVSAAPVILTKLAIRDSLISKGFPATDAATFAIKANIDVSQRVIDNKRFGDMIDVLANLIITQYDVYIENFGEGHTDEILNSRTKSIEISIE